jgi:hypothetical protein
LALTVGKEVITALSGFFSPSGSRDKGAALARRWRVQRTTALPSPRPDEGKATMLVRDALPV